MKRVLQKNMTRDLQRKTDLVKQLADHVLARGMAAASLRALAAAAGTSDRMLLYYFPDKATLIAAVLEEIAARMTALLDGSRVDAPMSAVMLETRLMPMLLEDAVWPFMRLWLEIASLAARGDADCKRVGEAIARGFVAWLAAQLDTPEEAVRLLMTIEGGILLKSLGLGADVRMAMTRRV